MWLFRYNCIYYIVLVVRLCIQLRQNKLRLSAIFETVQIAIENIGFTYLMMYGIVSYFCGPIYEGRYSEGYVVLYENT